MNSYNNVLEVSESMDRQEAGEETLKAYIHILQSYSLTIV